MSSDHQAELLRSIEARDIDAISTFFTETLPSLPFEEQSQYTSRNALESPASPPAQLLATAARADALEIFGVIYDALYTTNPGIPYECLRQAARLGSISLARAFIQREPSALSRTPPPVPHGRPGAGQIVTALRAGHLEYVDFILSQGVAVDHEWPRVKVLRAIVSLEQSDEELLATVKWVVQRGARIQGAGALKKLASYGTTEPAKMLLGAGADVEDLEDEDTSGTASALMEAVKATTSTTFTGGSCPMPTGFSSEAEPAGPYRTAWWDSGVLCANCGDFIDQPAEFPVEDVTATAPATTETITAVASSGFSAQSTTPSTSTETTMSSETLSTSVTTSSTSDISSESDVTTTSETSATSSESSETTTESGSTTFSSSSSSSTETSETTTASSTEAPTGTKTPPDSTTLTSSPATTTTAPAPTGPYPCHHRGGPNVETPYCQCSTETEGQTFFATMPLTDHVCAGYSVFPSSVTPTAPTGPYPCHHRGGPNVETPFCQCTTETLGQTFYTSVPTTHFVCAAYSTYPGDIDPTPTQVSGEAYRCDDARDSCDWAAEQFDDNETYTEEVVRLAFEDISGWDWFWDGDRGCIVNFSCQDYGEGMTGKEIKDAIAFMKENNDVDHCGRTSLSNTCEVVVHFCMEANGDCYYTPNYGASDNA